MSKSHHVIYMPGLGDHNPHGQTRILGRWQRSGLEVHFINFGWTRDEPLNAKLNQITVLIDELHSKGHLISLVGVSAGAGAALNVYTLRPSRIKGVVFICGKIVGGPHTVGDHYFKNNPVFRQSLQLTQTNLEKLKPQDKAKMLSLRPVIDEVVYKKYTVIPGVRTKTIPSLFHVPSIFLEITLFKRQTINFLKRQAVK